jgi:RNA polymerase sigma-70 factor (ECF subfamily)
MDLVAALLAGDTDRFAELVDAWSPAMLRIARFHVSNKQAAEDVVQEAWMAALRGLEGFEGRSSLRAWVCGIVANLARRYGSRERRTVPISSFATGRTVDPERFQGPTDRNPGGWRQFPSPWPSPEESVLGGEVRAVVDSALERLPERQRLVMELRDLHGYDGQKSPSC